MKTNFQRYSEFITDAFMAVTGGREGRALAIYSLAGECSTDVLLAGGPIDAPHNLMVGSLVSDQDYLSAVVRGETPVYEQRFATAAAAVAWLVSKSGLWAGVPDEVQHDLYDRLSEFGEAGVMDPAGLTLVAVLIKA